MMKGDMREGYAGSARMLADCARIVGNMRIGSEFTANDVCERLNEKVSPWGVSNKLKRIKGVEVVENSHPMRFKKTLEVWY
jgi:hypothetical protein